LILPAIRKAFPDDAILSEESGETHGTSGYRWILDPLDGPANFLAGIPLFSILLALEKKGTVLLAFCVFPMLSEVWVAERGKGTTLNGKRQHVSPVSSLQGKMFLGDGSSLLDHQTVAGDTQTFLGSGCRYRLLGHVAFGMTRVALGTAVGAVMRQGNVWDLAAPCLLVEEAGGTVTDFQGKVWDLKPRPLLATNGVLHDTILPLLR
jgi:myo-inositol-1(or 4)-monophosphatase